MTQEIPTARRRVPAIIGDLAVAAFAIAAIVLFSLGIAWVLDAIGLVHDLAVGPALGLTVVLFALVGFVVTLGRRRSSSLDSLFSRQTFVDAAIRLGPATEGPMLTWRLRVASHPRDGALGRLVRLSFAFKSADVPSGRREACHERRTQHRARRDLAATISHREASDAYRHRPRRGPEAPTEPMGTHYRPCALPPRTTPENGFGAHLPGRQGSGSVGRIQAFPNGRRQLVVGGRRRGRWRRNVGGCLRGHLAPSEGVGSACSGVPRHR